MKEKMHPDNTNRRIQSDAEDWFLKIQSAPASSEIRAGLHAWLAENPAHKTAYERLNKLWEKSGVLKNHPEIVDIIDRHLGNNQNKKLAYQPAVEKRRWFNGLGLWFPNFKLVAFACTVLLIVGGLCGIQTTHDEAKTYQTITGEQKTVSLPDGSTVYLDTQTTIKESFTGTLRKIYLKEGRALFSVLHDKDRPFVVAASRIVVQAIGTEFNVYKEGGGKVSVEVTKGSVRVMAKDKNELLNAGKKLKTKTIPDAPGRKMVSPKTLSYNTVKPSVPDLIAQVVTSGQKVVVDEIKAVYEIKHLDAKQANTWKDGRLCFKSKPLNDIITEINRYLDQKIVIGDDRLKNLQLSLNFYIRHRDEFLHGLKMTNPITSSVTKDGRILLRKSDQPPHGTPS